MARPGDEVVDPSGLRLVFLETAASSGGAAISLDWFVPPGGRLVALPHVHPFDTEGFEIFAGRARYRVGRRVSEQDAPYAYGVPPGAQHVHAANIGPTPLHVRQTVRPDPPDGPLLEGVEQFFETLFALAQRRKVTSAGVIVDPLQGAAPLSLLLPFSYLPWLPHGFQQVAIGGLARVAQGLGYAAHLEPRVGGARPGAGARRPPRSPEPTPRTAGTPGGVGIPTMTDAPTHDVVDAVEPVLDGRRRAGGATCTATPS